MMQENFDPFLAEVFYPYDLSYGQLQFRYIRTFGLIKIPALLDVLRLQQERPRYANVIRKIKLDKFLHLITIEKFIDIAHDYYLDNQEISHLLQILSPPRTVFDKDGFPYATYCENNVNENIILIDKGRTLSPIIEDFLRLMMNLDELEFVEMNYGNPEYEKFIQIENEYESKLENKMKHYKKIEEENLNTNRKFNENDNINSYKNQDSDKNILKTEENSSNQTKINLKTSNFNKLIFINSIDFNKLNFRKSPKIVNYNIFQLIELIGKMSNKIIIFNGVSELIRKKINKINIKDIDIIIENIYMNIDKNIRKRFPTINTLWYNICYYYKTGKFREKYQKEKLHISELENKAMWLCAIIQKLDYCYCRGDRMGLEIILKDHALELENQFSIDELKGYYQMCNWIPINK